MDKGKMTHYREVTGAGIRDVLRAMAYAEEKGDEAYVIPYLKALSFAVATPNMTFDERVLMFYRDEMVNKKNPHR